MAQLCAFLSSSSFVLEKAFERHFARANGRSPRKEGTPSIVTAIISAMTIATIHLALKNATFLDGLLDWTILGVKLCSRAVIGASRANRYTGW
jgi:hypothetical protein